MMTSSLTRPRAIQNWSRRTHGFHAVSVAFESIRRPGTSSTAYIPLRCLKFSASEDVTQGTSRLCMDLKAYRAGYIKELIKRRRKQAVRSRFNRRSLILDTIRIEFNRKPGSYDRECCFCDSDLFLTLCTCDFST